MIEGLNIWFICCLYEIGGDEIELHLGPQLHELHVLLEQEMYALRHGLEQIDELDEPVVAQLALSTEMMMIRGYELVEANGEARLVSQHVDDVELETLRAQALLFGLHDARYLYERALVHLLAAHGRVGQLGQHVLQIAHAVVAYVECARQVPLEQCWKLVREHLFARMRLEHF